MKTLSSIVLSFLLAILAENVTACVDYHPDSIRVIVSGDTAGCNLEIRVTNLNMFGGNPNQFCSCGVIGSYDLGPDKPFFIDYVVFVDAVSNLPVEGFDAFNFLPDASTSWEDVDPNNFDWSGFVSLVNSNGIVAGQEVDLVIRGHYEHADCTMDVLYISWQKFPILSGGGFGTDEWSDSNNDLALSHNDITYFDDILEWDDVEYNLVEPEYFDFLDNIVLSLQDLTIASFTVFPNPTADKLLLNLPFSTTIEIVDLQGKTVRTSYIERFSSLQVADLPTGLYLIRFQNDDKVFQGKFMRE